MTDVPMENLIDLNIENDGEEQHSLANQLSANLSDGKKINNECVLPKCLIVPSKEGRESIDNNPFDCVQKQATRPQDPFDIVEKEACAKARNSMFPPSDVKLGNLVSLGDGNPFSIPPVAGNSAVESTIYSSALAYDIDNESPPISMSIKSTPETCSSAVESDESSSNSTKMRKAMECRKRLLKLSISNSTFNSPLSYPSRHGNGRDAIFSAVAHLNDDMIATESPMKLIDDEVITENRKFTDPTENAFEADLELLSIPMLKELQSPVPEEAVVTKEDTTDASEVEKIVLPDLSTIREKLRLKRMEDGNNQDVMSLIDSLKTLLCENDVVDEDRKKEANCVLRKLSRVLNKDKQNNKDTSDQRKNEECGEMLIPIPKSIVRQSTFDMDLHLPANNEKCEYSGVNDISPMADPLPSRQSLSPAREIPECMLISSATYDSEPVAKQNTLRLSDINSISPTATPAVPNGTVPLHPDVSDIIQQITKLLEQHEIGSQYSSRDNPNGSESSEDNKQQQSTNVNPTFIVFMPATTISNQVEPISKPSINSSFGHDDFPVLNSISGIRRRSQSLSIHDNIKILQLPLRSQATPSVFEEALSPGIESMPKSDETAVEFKTPMRTALRRNSLSSGTPHTPLTSLNNGVHMANARRTQNASIPSRYSVGLTKLHDRASQQHAVVHPILRNNLNTFKPDLKKKTKQQTTSIMKSKGPLKAVIPVKKVAPMLTTTMATPEQSTFNSRLPSAKTNMESSLNLFTKPFQIPHTSTPISLDITDFPTACSTPAVPNTFARPTGTVTKKTPRFSVTTPTSKLQQPFTSTTGLKKRALPELTKPKSPVRMRTSLTPMTAPSVKGRHSLKLHSNASKQTNTRPITRLSTRSSFCTGTTVTNKENKKP